MLIILPSVVTSLSLLSVACYILMSTEAMATVTQVLGRLGSRRSWIQVQLAVQSQKLESFSRTKQCKEHQACSCNLHFFLAQALYFGHYTTGLLVLQGPSSTHVSFFFLYIPSLSCAPPQFTNRRKNNPGTSILVATALQCFISFSCP